ncbi:MAG: hypothetical protein LUD27_01725 [Clostridia bacterium]|nr:hypothetical protein [Clostridia bacterium]
MKKFTPHLLSLLCGILCVLVLFGGFFAAFASSADSEQSELKTISIWQIDSFEGGKGSRAEYLRSIGEKFAKEENVYIEVTSLSLDAAAENLKRGVSPDMISYGAGACGLESYVNQDYPAEAWCRGGYCLLSLETDDFSAANSQNTVINAGKNNLTGAAALFCGLYGADILQPTSAYVNLINGNYKFLLGAQRDIVRLMVRGVNFYVKPITEFNDLYQYISVLSSGEKGWLCGKFTEFLLKNGESVSDICLFCDGYKLYDNALSCMEGLSFDYKMPALVSEGFKNGVTQAIKDCDTEKLKSLLK